MTVNMIKLDLGVFLANGRYSGEEIFSCLVRFMKENYTFSAHVLEKFLFACLVNNCC